MTEKSHTETREVHDSRIGICGSLLFLKKGGEIMNKIKEPGTHEIFGRYLDLVEQKEKSKLARAKWAMVNDEGFAKELSDLELSILDLTLSGKSIRSIAKFHNMNRLAVQRVIEKCANVTKSLLDKFEV